jgi:hypothetical protein
LLSRSAFRVVPWRLAILVSVSPALTIYTLNPGVEAAAGADLLLIICVASPDLGAEFAVDVFCMGAGEAVSWIGASLGPGDVEAIAAVATTTGVSVVGLNSFKGTLIGAEAAAR